MNEQTLEDIISALYDMVQDARAVPLAADKCIVERDKVLDMLDEIECLPENGAMARIYDMKGEFIGVYCFQAEREWYKPKTLFLG